KLQHVLWDLLVRDVLEVLGLFANLAGIAQRDPEKALAARLERDDVLAGGEHDSPERHHAFLADRLANDGERLLTDFAVGSEVVRAAQIELVDLSLRHELVDLDRALALDRDGLELFGLKLDVLALADLVAFDDL